MQLRSALFLVGENSEKTKCFFEETETKYSGGSIPNGYDKSLREVATILGITGERVRQIEMKALNKLRHPKRSKLLRAFLYNEKLKESKNEKNNYIGY